MHEWENEYTAAVGEFLEHAADWLGPAERPLCVQLRALAGTLDKQMRADSTVQSAAASQFAQTWARLEKRNPARAAAGDGGDPFGLEPIPGLESGLMHGAGCMCPEHAGVSS